MDRIYPHTRRAIITSNNKIALIDMESIILVCLCRTNNCYRFVLHIFKERFIIRFEKLYCLVMQNRIQMRKNFFLFKKFFIYFFYASSKFIFFAFFKQCCQFRSYFYRISR
ncbi:hypothetical protein AU468_13385 [Alkalispirochaeta sphaeroplastigenens]|uniref:Uncharacterized protein n=1 Tax=Alkalispirochaeta sphaeroplastigenens TaxID=1187066 RepID=A0A2S4JFW8_9SPIO|nr:hypothetical protein AU468_13385 [Alkalispirochaeta sphaeroplastigenens]